MSLLLETELSRVIERQLVFCMTSLHSCSFEYKAALASSTHFTSIPLFMPFSHWLGCAPGILFAFSGGVKSKTAEAVALSYLLKETCN